MIDPPEPPASLDCCVLRSDEPEMVLLSFEPTAKAKLTSAECAIAVGIMRGLSNAEIARERGAAVRTVANQVASLFRRLEISSRAELVARISVQDFL